MKKTTLRTLFPEPSIFVFLIVCMFSVSMKSLPMAIKRGKMAKERANTKVLGPQAQVQASRSIPY